jgi:hypothetical protein
MMTKLDLKRDLQYLYKPSAKQPEIIAVPPMNFMMIDGVGDPNESQPFADAVQALNSAAFTLKFAIRKARGIDYAVMPTEGLWWTERLEDFRIDQPANWLWTIMIMQPDFITAEDVEAAVAAAKAKKKLAALDLIRFDSYHEGRSAQIMHIGPYGLAEVPTVERLDSFIRERGERMTGKHHEIYISDPNRAAPEKLKTILRHPIDSRHTWSHGG